jgi:predicted porin
MTELLNRTARLSCAPRLVPTAMRCVALASALCCAGAAQAQATTPPTVTLYGLADVGITQVTGMKGGSVTQVASGIMEGSRWGLKGNEDLGGGYRAVFTLENRFEMDTGSVSNRPISGNQLPDRLSQTALMKLPGYLQPFVTATGASLATELGINVGKDGGRLFDRQAFVGLVTPFGALLAGRQYTPAFETNSNFDIMATQSGLSAGQLISFPSAMDIRASNALVYRIQQGPVSGSLMYAAGEVAGGRNSQGRTLGINGMYKTDTFAVGFGHNSKNNELGERSLRTSVIGASLNMDGSTFSTMAVKVLDDNPSGLSGIASGLMSSAAFTTPLGPAAAGAAAAIQSAFKEGIRQDGHLLHIGYRYVTGANTISLAYNDYKDKRPAQSSTRSYGAAYTYALSKRTDLNAVLVRYDNNDNAQKAAGGNGYLGGFTASRGTDSTSLAVGIRHRF